MTTVFVYVGDEGQKNLETGIQESVWGWKPGVVEGKAHLAVLQSLRAGDYLVLGSRGLGRISAEEAHGRTAEALHITRLTGGLYQDHTTVWEDETYPYRVPMEPLDVWEKARKDDLGEDAWEALRRSACANGAAKRAEAEDSFMEKALTKVLGGWEQELAQAGQPTDAAGDADDPADLGILELPPATDRLAYVRARTEQKALRRTKLAGRHEVPCDLCQLVLPKRLVHTAHIKRRSVASPTERADLNNVMFACVLGCDSLFEHGYVYVDADGAIRPSEPVASSTHLTTAVERLCDTCTAHTDASADYFAWHRHTIAHVS
ncbi:hypothetical protein [Nocardiopsis aegyptia]|uniref:HNH endonuclease n=1 Tax=Nocardiopsis aegyptia TaxID=220378 RepID=A0A7Z0ET35_9ACTN|nr:hypothetical protein [Nocardiopsis aegyptia]NYJ37793.1 hypothetical protein [Nocardiopsis aegyptia]